MPIEGLSGHEALIFSCKHDLCLGHTIYTGQFWKGKIYVTNIAVGTFKFLTYNDLLK